MLKTKYKIGLGLLITAASALASCGKTKDDGKVVFWSSFGSAYTSALDQIVAGVAKDTKAEEDALLGVTKMLKLITNLKVHMMKSTETCNQLLLLVTIQTLQLVIQTTSHPILDQVF